MFDKSQEKARAEGCGANWRDLQSQEPSIDKTRNSHKIEYDVVCVEVLTDGYEVGVVTRGAVTTCVILTVP